MTLRQELRRRWWVVLLAVVVFVALFGQRLATFYTDILWFDSVGFSDVFWTLLATRLGLGLGAGALMTLLLAGNLLLARRLAPVYRIPSSNEEVIERYREAVEPYSRWVLLTIAVLIGVLTGASMVGEWQTFLLALNAQPFGLEDPHFGRDVGFFVFRLPLWRLLSSWLFTSLTLTIVLTAVAHYLFGGIRPQSPGQKITPQANAHLSVLLAAVFAVRAWGFWLDRYYLSYSQRGQATGLSYTDANAQLIAYQLLAIIAAACVVLFLLNLRARGWLLPSAGLGILLVAAIVLGTVYPAVIQRLQVDPQELPREEEFIARNLEMTRFAYGLDDVEVEAFPAGSELSDAEVAENARTLESIRLWDPATLQNTYQQLQEFRPYYDFRDVDVDRYELDGETEQVMIAVRELNERDLPAQAQTWQNERLVYTHGYGLVSSSVSTSTEQGQPVFLVNNIPPEGVEELAIENPRIYFGENPPLYSIVGGSQVELDYPLEEGPPQTYRYTGADGVAVGSPLRRLAFALRFAEPNIILSSLIDGESKIMFNRNVRQRVEQVAPFLKLDHDMYPVAVDDRIKYVLDAYTTTDMVPYSERVDLAGLTLAEQVRLEPTQTPEGTLTFAEQRVQVPGLTGRANYIRNSVKAVVDAYDGTVTLYVVDPEDPVVKAWQSVFPDSFTPVSEASEDLRRHFRYPEDMFRVQAELFRTYHIPTAEAFYTKEDAWNIPRDAAYQQNQAALNAQAEPRPMRPYYLLMRLPGETEEEFALIQPFTPAERNNLIAWLAARSDPDDYGQLKSYEMPPNRTVFGPEQAQARIDQDDAVAEQITLWNQSGARVIYGNLLVIPIEDSLLYAQPLFLRAEQSDIPELRKTVLVFGDSVVMEDTLAGALAALFGEQAPGVRLPEGAEDTDVPPAPEPGEGDQAPSEGIDPRVADLISQALEHFDAAERALRDGDLGTYQSETQAAEDLLEQAQGLVDGQPVEGGADDDAPTPTEAATEPVGAS